MFFSVIIPTYNRSELLEQCLEAFYGQSVSKKDFEIIVVDDGSTDNTKEIVSKFVKKQKNIKYVRQKNSGQGVARNLGISKARGKVIVFGQDDIIPTRDFLFEHQKYHYLHPEENASVLGFIAWRPTLKVNDFMEWVTNGSSILGKFGGHQFAFEKLQGRELADYNFFYTSNISLKRNLLLKQKFDKNFSGYGWEDIELGYRLEKKEGLKLYYNANAIAYHDHYMDLSSLKGRMFAIGKSAWAIDKKHPELKKVPKGKKLLVLKAISSSGFILLVRFLNFVLRGGLKPLYFYCLSKKYFLEGLKAGSN